MNAFAAWACRSFPALLNPQFLKFLVVGVVNSAFGYGCYFVLLKVGFNDAAALFCATVAGVFFNFKTTGSLVFQSGDNRLIFRFAAVYAVLYGINLVTIKALEYAGTGPAWAGALALPPMAVLSFLLNRSFVFTKCPR
jgi:putative flippase GtrA